MPSIETTVNNYIRFVEEVIDVLDNSYVILQYDEKEDEGQECINDIPTGHRMFHISNEAYRNLFALIMQQKDLEEVLSSGCGFIESSCGKCCILSMVRYYIIEKQGHISVMGSRFGNNHERLFDIWHKFHRAFDNLAERTGRINMPSIEIKVKNYIRFVEKNYIRFVDGVIDVLDNSYVTLQYDEENDGEEDQECINGVPTGHRMFHISEEAYPKLTELAIQQDDLEEVLAGRFGFSFVSSNCYKCHILSMIYYYIIEKQEHIRIGAAKFENESGQLFDIWSKFQIAFHNLARRTGRIT